MRIIKSKTAECDECGESPDNLVVLGTDSRYGDDTAVVCLRCAKAAVEILEKEGI